MSTFTKHHCTGMRITSRMPENGNSIAITIAADNSENLLEQYYTQDTITLFDLPVEITAALECALPSKCKEITPPTPLQFTKMIVKRFGSPDTSGPFGQEKGMAEALLATALCGSLGDDHPLAELITQFRIAEVAHSAPSNGYTADAISDCRAAIENMALELDEILSGYEAECNKADLLYDKV